MNQRSVVIERPTGSSFLPGLYGIVGTIKNTDGTARNAIIDNLPVKSIFYAVAVKHVTADGTAPLTVYGAIATGTKIGSKKVTFQIPALSTLQYMIFGSQTESIAITNINADTTIIPTV